MSLDEKNVKDIVHSENFETLDEPDEEARKRERTVRRKLDMTLMPMIWLLYLFNYLDRNNIAQAKLNTLEDDLGLVGTNFNVAVSILNVGYVLGQIPSNMILTRVRPSLYIPFWVCAWSIISGATAATQDYGGLVAVRFCLGIAEAPFFPGAFYLLSCWYTKKELALRTAILYSGLVLATAFSGLLAAGIFAGLDGTRGLAGWRWLFLLEGVASILAGGAAFLVLPDYPNSTTGSGSWLFTAEERQIAIDRVERDRVSNQESNDSVWHGLRLAVTDFRVWIFALILCANHTAYGFNNFYPSIVEGFELGTRTVTLLCTAPPYLIGALITFFVANSSDRHNERGLHISIPMLVAVVGFVISVATLNVPARYVASFLYITGCFSANSIVYTWSASTTGQTREKRAAATAIINVMGQLGNIWSPYFFLDNEAPRYTKAMILMMAFAVLSAICCWGMKLVLRRDNRKLLQSFEGTGRIPQLYTL